MAETDRELLELAAKAARIKIDKSEFNGGGRGNTGFDVLGNAVLDWHDGKKWNPLTDDGDALRLAVKMGLFAGPEFWHELSAEYAMSAMRGDRQDPYAATRRAIVRAAAAIGKGAKP